ncbi:transposase [Streptomyces rubiginosohelvolus]|uniref:Transposase n=1 Tax=Streptomyces rubiginosohelvolus TaxID=67362 RepID=A0ABW6ESK3_9ACTN
MRTGASWRDLPWEYGPWQTVYGVFRRWQRDGTWPELLTRLQVSAYVAICTAGTRERAPKALFLGKGCRIG